MQRAFCVCNCSAGNSIITVSLGCQHDWTERCLEISKAHCVCEGVSRDPWWLGQLTEWGMHALTLPFLPSVVKAEESAEEGDV